jgi:hypothetical protein
VPRQNSVRDCLVEVRNKGNSWNFIFDKSGATNTYSTEPLTSYPIISEIASFKIYYHPNTFILSGLQMWDREGNMMFESAWKWVFTSPIYRGVETGLLQGERIVGIQSHTKN